MKLFSSWVFPPAFFSNFILAKKLWFWTYENVKNFVFLLFHIIKTYLKNKYWNFFHYCRLYCEKPFPKRDLQSNANIRLWNVESCIHKFFDIFACPDYLHCLYILAHCVLKCVWFGKTLESFISERQHTYLFLEIEKWYDSSNF